MPSERESPELSADDDRSAPTGTTVAAPERNRTARKKPDRAPTPPRSAPTPSSSTARDSTASTATPPSSTPPSATRMRPDSGVAATMPMAAAALGALTAISAQYGDAAPSGTGQPYVPPSLPSDAPTGPVVWDGASGAQYSGAAQGRSGRGDAIGELNAELARLLDGAADDTTAGRAAVASIIAETDAALTALGTVSATAAGQSQVMTTLTDALQRAGTVLGRDRAASAMTADKVNELAERYVQQTRPSRPSASRPVAHGGGPPLARPSGTEGQWINEALAILRQQGYDTDQIDPSAIAAIIQHESGGNPHAINDWDSNAAAGTPSKGLMQTIDPTFNAYALPGHTNVWNPVDNIIAGVRYSIDRYGSVSDVPGVAQMREGGSYVGY